MELEQHFPFGLSTRWQCASEHNIRDSYLKNWLLDTGSLTERIQSMCRHFQVRVLGQQKVTLHPDELELMGSHETVVREVILLADSVPWVFARSVLPKSLVMNEWQHLGNQPLGSLLFNDNRFVRSDFELAKFDGTYFSSLNVQPRLSSLYGRRSLFKYQDTPILVAEVFLPQSPVYHGEHS